MKKGDKIIWDSHFGYELGYFVADKGVMCNTHLVDLVTGKITGEVSDSIGGTKPYTKELHEELSIKYGYYKEYPVKKTIESKSGLTHLEMLKAILDNQDKAAVESNNWNAHSYKEREDSDSRTIIIDNAEVGFAFNKEGQFEGIFNFKQ